MASETVLEKIVVKFVGDTKGFVKETNKANNAVKKFSKDSKGRIRDAEGKFVSGMNRMGAEMSMVEGKMKKLVVGVGVMAQEIGKKMQKVGRGMASVGKQLTARVTLPLVAAGIASAKMAMDFDTSMNKIVSLVGLSRETVEGFKSSVLELAGQTARAPAELADAMFFITSAGLTGQDALDALEVSAKAAAVGLGETAVIADLVTSAMNAYGPANLSASNAGDILTATVREGKLEASALAGAFSRVLPLGSALGIEMNELGAAFAAMSRTGTNANEAATQIKGIMVSLLKPTKQGAEVLDKMGLSYEGLRTQLKEKGLLDTLQTLTEKFDGNLEETGMLFGNVNALSGVLDMMGSGADTTAEIFGKLENTTGDLNKAFDNTTNTAGFKLAQMWARLKVLMVEVGSVIATAVMPWLEKVGAWIKEATDWWNELDVSQQKNYLTWAAIAAAIGPVLIAIGTVITVVGSLIASIGTITTAISAMNGALATTVLSFGAAVIAGVALGVWLTQYHSDIIAFNAAMEETIKLQSKLAKRFKDQTTSIVDTASNAEDPTQAIQKQIEIAEKELQGKKNSLRSAQKRESEFGMFARATGNKMLEATQQEVKENIELVNILKDRIELLREAGQETVKNTEALLASELTEMELAVKADVEMDAKALEEKAKVAFENASPELQDAIMKVRMEEESIKKLKDEIAASMEGSTTEQIAAVQSQVLAERRASESEAKRAANKAESAANKVLKTLADKNRKNEEIKDIIGKDKFNQISSSVNSSLGNAPQSVKDDILKKALNDAVNKAKKQALLAFKIQNLKDQHGGGGGNFNNPNSGSFQNPNQLSPRQKGLARRKKEREEKVAAIEARRARRKDPNRNLSLSDAAAKRKREEGIRSEYGSAKNFPSRIPEGQQLMTLSELNKQNAKGEEGKNASTRKPIPVVGKENPTKKFSLEVESKKQTEELVKIRELLEKQPEETIIQQGAV